MRITIHSAAVICMALGLLGGVAPPQSLANEPQDAHAMAHQFANAHEPKSETKINAKNALQSKQVEGAFKARSQETELKTTDQILESIEARTRAIEALLEQSTSDKWNVYVGKPANVVVERSVPTEVTRPEIVLDTSTNNLSSGTPEANTTASGTPAAGTTTIGAPAAPRINWATTTSPAIAPNVTDASRGPESQFEKSQGKESQSAESYREEGQPASPITEAAAQAAPAPDVTELPEPGYALGGPGNLRHGLAEASSILSTATVLLKMEPGNTGLRRFKKTADPVLCGRRHCYMSKGFQDKAYRMLRGTALGPFNTLGRRAGACRQKLRCVFRHVDLMDDGVLLQPVDLKFMRHDRRAYRNMKADPSCKLSAGRLHCANPIKAKTWTAWIVPEHIALEAGSDALQTALQDGLPETATPSIHVKRADP